ncbi:hypothetical protein LTR10_017758 [Elasticomyces elasticus]|uniref:Interferon-related developmental regulator N-terminal domain-containing protein n=1 Tax=Exophiala sideris TaxID=1016849 RepID=A0ABR0JC74_9EURO|nr:hypothetical protein LTR10_017758 [Elasticomyces elasticus]KAK5031266.1 hypothetical protein LTS07_005001 [Exophiala sideris]KAK5038986.1 hypothetical protein LTR13_004017 [Exophiala sideris]KAK5060871.1 hypothetical protein LTR69_005470 [Exophiala sideris]KAK5183782.1 hypothetical protein LTR44_004064 [Eurotiomycetes sp. CCFEE 6388]
MHEDLRRRALESGKTVSKKAISKQSSRGSSRANSAANSRAASRAQSREVSDDEDPGNGNLSDDTTQSINSIDALLESEDFNEQTTDATREQLNSTIDDLLERKGSSSKSREESLTSYVRCLTSHYLAEVLHGRVSNILDALGRSVKAETSEREATLALRAIAVTAITFADDRIYETVQSLLKRTATDSQSLEVKTAAIHAWGICLSFGGAGEDEIADAMTIFLEIASSDGAFVGADDSAEVVAAALHTYGFLATEVEDLEHESEDAISTFLDQLDADDVRVQVAAGENIALLYEKSYTPREEGESGSSSSPSSEEEEEEGETVGQETREPDTSGLIKRYNAYHNSKEVLEKVKGLAGLSTKSMNRRDKKLLHQTFASVLMTVEQPQRGLQSNSTTKKVVRIHREGEMRVDKWWKLIRLTTIRRLLGGGFVNHYFEGNKQVLNALPMIMRGTDQGGLQSPRKSLHKASKGRYRDTRRFISADAPEE